MEFDDQFETIFNTSGDFEVGQQVTEFFYKQNWWLLKYHGIVLPNNYLDCVDIKFNFFENIKEKTDIKRIKNKVVFKTGKAKHSHDTQYLNLNDTLIDTFAQDTHHLHLKKQKI